MNTEDGSHAAAETLTLKMCLEGVKHHLTKRPSDTAALKRKQAYEAELERQGIRETQSSGH